MKNKILLLLFLIHSALVIVFSGCVSAKIDAGPTIDTDGKIGAEAGLMLGFNFNLSSANILNASFGVIASKLELSKRVKPVIEPLELNYVHLPDEYESGYRLGGGLTINFNDNNEKNSTVGYNIKLAYLRSLNRKFDKTDHIFWLIPLKMDSWIVLGGELKFAHFLPAKGTGSKPYYYFRPAVTLEYYIVNMAR